MILLCTSATVYRVPPPQGLVTGVYALPTRGASSGEVLNALVHEGDVYVVGKRWSKEEGGESLWLWRVGSDGQPVWHTGLSEPQRNGFPEAHRMEIDPESGRLLVLCRQRPETYWASVDTEDGSYKREELPVRGLPLSDGGYLTSKKQSRDKNSSLMRFTRLDGQGSLVWNCDWAPKIELPQATKGSYRSISGREVVPMRDGGFAIAGMAGNYSKFGVADRGGSWVWLLRLSAEGEVVASHAFKDAYLSVHTNGRPLVERGNSLWLSYYRLNPPDDQEEEKKAGGRTFRPAFQRCVARFDSGLNRESEHLLAERRVPDSVTFTSEPLFFFPMEGSRILFAAGSDGEGDVSWSVRAGLTPSGLAIPCRAVSDETTRCLVATLSNVDSTPGGNPMQTLLIFMKPGE